MDKNIDNIIFGIKNLTDIFLDSNNKKDSSYEILANFIQSINNDDKGTNIYFIVDNNELEISLDTNDSSNKKKDSTKMFLKNFKIKIKENNIKFLTRKNEEDENLDSKISLDEIVDISKENNILIDNTIIIFSELQFGEVAFLDGFFSVAIYSNLLLKYIDIKDFQKISNKIINIDEDDIQLDSLNYDFLTFNESQND